ncbi:MAG: sensor histidine kinase, partial [Fidelibacterota bacterium]
DINIFRIIQESLTNISKHAHANQVGVSLELVENNVTLSIKDDGSGFDINSVRNKRSQKSGMGIIGMEERTNNLGGTFEIFSEPNKGCHLLFTFPHSKSKIASIKSNDVDAG